MLLGAAGYDILSIINLFLSDWEKLVEEI